MTPIAGRHALRRVGIRNHTGLDDRTLRKAAARGELVQVWRGVYAPEPVWRSLGIEERRRLVVLAAQEHARSAPVLSHRSAAVLLGIPFTGRQAPEVDVLASVAAGSRTEHGYAKHATRAPDLEVVETDGVRITSVARTVVELAMTLPFRDALAAADWALAEGVSRDLLFDLLDLLATGPARKRGHRVIRFADARSGSAGESKSRAIIDELGFPIPDLQTRFSDHAGFIGAVDFFWSEVALIGEFDGAVKYRDPEMLRGRSPDRVLLDEKRREDRLRATGPRVVRWMNEDLTMQRLGAVLFAAGLRPLLHRAASA